MPSEPNAATSEPALGNEARSEAADDLRLLARLRDGDPTALARIVEAHLDEVVAVLRRRFPPPVDDHLIQEKAIDALIRLRDEPGRYDPQKRGLRGFLVMDAAGDVRNAVKTLRMRAQKRVALPVELFPDVRNDSCDEPPAPRTALRERLAPLFQDPIDLDAALLMLGGERKTARFAELFGLADRPPDEQRTLVKRHKDRITKMLQRNGVAAL